MSSVVHMSNSSKGFTAINNEFIDSLMSCDLTQRQFKIVLAIHRLTAGYHVSEVKVTGKQLEGMTGIPRNYCSSEVNKLIRFGVLIREGGSRDPIAINQDSKQWSIPEPKTKTIPYEELDSVTRSVTKDTVTHHVTSTVTDHVTKDESLLYLKEKRNIVPNGTRESGDSESTAQQKKSEPKYPPCPAQKIIDLYHEIMPDNPKVIKRQSNDLLRSIRARWRETAWLPDAQGEIKEFECWTVEFWEKYFVYCSQSAFLTGQVPPRDDRPPFIADLKWILGARNQEKILSGKYHRGA